MSELPGVLEVERCLVLIDRHRGKTDTLVPRCSGPGFMSLELKCDSPFGWKSMELNTTHVGWKSMELNTTHVVGTFLLHKFDRIRK